MIPRSPGAFPDPIPGRIAHHARDREAYHGGRLRAWLVRGTDADKKQTKSGIHLPDKIEIPTLTGRVVAISAQVAHDDDYPIQQYDKVLFTPKQGIPVDFEGDNRLYVIPVEDIVAVFRKE